MNIVECLKNTPNDWEVGEYYLTHKPSGCRLWIGNGAKNLNINGNEHILTKKTRQQIWLAIEEWVLAKDLETAK